MNAEEIIEAIRSAKKQTPVKVFLKARNEIKFEHAKVFAAGNGVQILFGDWAEIAVTLDAYAEEIEELVIENDCRNSALPLLDLKQVNARIEPGAIIRSGAEIGDKAVIMMGAIINIGAVIGEETMIDMGAVLGGRAVVGRRCHVGAGAVLAGVVEPASAAPVTVEDDVFIGANAVICEGVRVGRGAVVAAGAVVIRDVPANAMVAGVPARIVKQRDEHTCAKTALVEALRGL